MTRPDAELYEQIAACFQEELGRMAYRRCRDANLAEDAAQDALVIAFESLESYRGDAPIDHWLKRLVTSACSRLKRGRKNSPDYNLPLDESIGSRQDMMDGGKQEVAVLLGERISLLREALEDVPEDNRALLLLHEGNEVPLADLADRYDMTIDSVKSRLKRTRAKLRARLIELADEEN